MLPLVSWLTACCLPLPATPSSGDRPPPSERTDGTEAGEVPLFVRPFADDHPVTNYFDHGPKGAKGVLTTTGGVTWGIDDHHAYDFGMPVGTELFAMADGVVLRAGDLGPKKCAGGNTAPDNVQVQILHTAPDGNTYLSRLQHLSKPLVEKGDEVKAGQLVALSGNTGCSSGPHLHLHILHVTDARKGTGWPVDPYGWSGRQPDPRAERGQASPVLWKPGEAPPIRRVHKGLPEGADFGPHRVVFLDGVDPVRGERVDIGVRKGAKRPRSLKGLSLRNAAGDTLALPDRTLRPGRSFTVWTNRTDPGRDAISWDRDTEVWDDRSDCAMLVDSDSDSDSDGDVVVAVPIGRGPSRCP